MRAASEFASLRWAGVGVSARLAELVTSLASDVKHGIVSCHCDSFMPIFKGENGNTVEASGLSIRTLMRC